MKRGSVHNFYTQFLILDDERLVNIDWSKSPLYRTYLKDLQVLDQRALHLTEQEYPELALQGSWGMRGPE